MAGGSAKVPTVTTQVHTVVYSGVHAIVGECTWYVPGENNGSAYSTYRRYRGIRTDS